MNIQFIIAIKPDGSITQTSIVRDEENEVLSGKCISVDDNTLTVGFENQDDYTLYYLDKKSRYPPQHTVCVWQKQAGCSVSH